MAAHTIFIDGYIGSMGYSKQFIRSQLLNNKKNQVIVKLSSLGGSVDHALSIFDQFKEHGNVTVELSAFVASAATLLSLGAKNIRMNENSFYLIHKPMSWVDEWNTMNEDDIESLIEKLEKQKKELATVTLQMTRMYVKKTGKTIEEVINLMKQDTWLNAEEALRWGFVDEIYQPEEAVNYLESEQLVALINANGMPALPRKNQNTQPTQTLEDSLFQKIWNKINNKAKEEKSLKINKMNKQFLNVNKTLGIESLESADEGIFLNQEQLDLIENRLSLDQQIVAERDAAVTERDSAVTERDSVATKRDNTRTELTAVISAFDAVDATVAAAKTPEEKADALRALLASRPGTSAEGNRDSADPAGGKITEEDWDTINNLPHNRAVDINS